MDFIASELQRNAVKARRRVRRTFLDLPQYAYDPRLRNYVDITTGRMVRWQNVAEAIDIYLSQKERVLENLAEAYARGELPRELFYVSFAGELAKAHKVSAALAQGGWHRMTPTEWGVVGARLKQDYARLRNFIDDIDSGRYDRDDGSKRMADIKQRARAYSGNAFGTYHAIDRRNALQDVTITAERWMIQDDDACDYCKMMAAKGWVPKGALDAHPPAHPHCRCWIIYQRG